MATTKNLRKEDEDSICVLKQQTSNHRTQHNNPDTMAPNSTAALAAGEGQTSEAAAVTAAATSAIQTTAPAQQQQQQPPPTTALAATHALDGSLLTKYNLMHHHGGIATMPLHHPFVHANGAFVQQPGGAIGIHHPAGAALVTRGDPRAFVGHPAVTMNHPPTAVFSPTIAPSIPSADGTEVSNYKDYSKHTGDTMSEQQHAPSTTSSGKDPSFPVKLHRILSAADHEEFITWLPHGRSWRVLKPKAFEAKIIPLYFRHAKYASFMRQVNGWGFKRITQGPDHNSYYHELFLRGLPHLCHKMTRPPKTKNGTTPPQDNNTVHPDFYHLSMVAPLPPAGGAARQTQPQAPHQQFQPQSVYITSASSASPALTATEASGEGSGERSSNYSDDVGGASDESGSGKERGDRVTRPTQGGRVASDSSSADSKEQDAGSDGANSVKNCSSSSSAYAGGSEGGGDSGSDSDPLSDDAPKQSLSQSKVAAHNKSMESSSSATSSSTVSSKQGRSLQQPSKQAQARAPMMFPPTMLPPNSATPMPTMQQFPGSNMPYIIVQQPPGAAPGQQQQQQPMIVQQQAPQQQQLLRVVNQSGGEVGYIQMPQHQPGMPMQVQPQQMMQAAPGGFVQAAPPGAQMAIQGMPGMQTFMPAMQPQMQPMMQQWPPQMQAVTPQQVQQMAAMQQQQQMQQQMQMIHPSQMLATPQQMQQQQQQQPRFQQPLAFPTAPAPRK